MTSPLEFFPQEPLPEDFVIRGIRQMRSSGSWALEDIAFYNRVSVRAVRLLSDDCAKSVDESKIGSVFFPRQQQSATPPGLC